MVLCDCHWEQYVGLRIGQHSRTVQRQIDTNVRKIRDGMRHLASGKRVDGAADDPAGSQIAESFTTEIKGSTRAARNAYDGANLARVSEASLGTVTQIIHKIKELAVRAASDTLQDRDRVSLQAGARALTDEVQSISEKTHFADVKVLDGSFMQKAFHIGGGYRDATMVTIADSGADYLGRYAIKHGARVTADALERGDLVINGVRVRGTVDIDDRLSTTQVRSSAIAKAEAINDASALSKVSAFVNANEFVARGDITGGTLDGTNYLIINGEAISGMPVIVNDADDRLVASINTKSAKTGVVARLNEQSRLVLTAEDGRNIHIETAGQAHAVTGLLDNAGETVGRAGLTLFSEDLFTVTDPDDAGGEAKVGMAEDDIIGPNELDVLSTVDISTRRGANHALVILDRVQESVLSARGQLGGLENRLEFTVSRLNEATKNAYIAKGKVVDADIAKESANLTKNQIVQTAFSNVLAQANNESYKVLQLL